MSRYLISVKKIARGTNNIYKQENFEVNIKDKHYLLRVPYNKY